MTFILRPRTRRELEADEAASDGPSPPAPVAIGQADR